MHFAPTETASPRSMFLPRPRLTEKTIQAIKTHNLAVVIAPTGYGKTALARSIVGASGKNAYCYTVPAGAHEARFLWHDMFSLFEEQGMSIASSLRKIGFPETASQARRVMELLQGYNTPLCLLLDDYHNVTDQAMNAFWEEVTKANLPRFHLVILSRTRPNMRLEELRIKKRAILFEQDVLSFSQAETDAYFQAHGIYDPAAPIESQRYSEGWPAALWLCLQSWMACGRLIPYPGIESLLADTVFSAYTKEEQDLLMRLSVLDSFTEQEASKIASSPQTSVRLRTLREKNAFLTFDMKNGRYQFHGIFRDFLHKELAAASHIAKPPLYRLAGECCWERRELVAAFRLFTQAGRDEDLNRLLELFLSIEEDRTSVYFAEEIFQTAVSLPWRIRLQNPMGYLSFIALFTTMWNDRRTLTLLDEAEDRFSTAPDLPELLRKRLKGECEIIRGVMSCTEPARLLAHYKEAARLLEGPSVIQSRDLLWNFGCPSFAFLVLLEPGELRKTLRLTKKQLPLFMSLSDGIGKEGDKSFQAEYWLEQGWLEKAEPLLLDVLRKTKEPKHIVTAIMAAFNLARVQVALGNADDAVRPLQDLRQRVESIDYMEVDGSFDMAEGYINAILGRVKQIPQWLKDGEFVRQPLCPLPQMLGFALTTHAKALLLQEDYQQLAFVADDLAANAASFKTVYPNFHSKILKSLVAWYTRKQSEAMRQLRSGLEIARADNLVLPIAEYGNHILPLLRRLKRGETKDAYLEAVTALAGRIAQVSEHDAINSKSGLLTPREWEFMRCVAMGMSNPNIAQKLGIAEVTVRKALGRAYTKLGVGGRFEAAQRFIDIYGDSGNTNAS